MLGFLGQPSMQVRFTGTTRRLTLALLRAQLTRRGDVIVEEARASQRFERVVVGRPARPSLSHGG